MILNKIINFVKILLKKFLKKYDKISHMKIIIN